MRAKSRRLVFAAVGLHTTIGCARPKVDQEVDWPSTCTMLKALSKVSPAEVRGLLPVMHEVTRRITNRPVISKAAESGRLMVAEDLELRIIEAVTASLLTANNRAVAILVSFVQGRWLHRHTVCGTMQFCWRRRYRSRRPMWAFFRYVWHGFRTAMCRLLVFSLCYRLVLVNGH